MKNFISIVLAIVIMGWLGSCLFGGDCSYTGCSGSVYKNGWCYDHYVYASLTGDFY